MFACVDESVVVVYEVASRYPRAETQRKQKAGGAVTIETKSPGR